MKDEFPQWIYPPDGGQGKLIHSPEEYIKGWQDTPAGNLGAIGERVIGQVTVHVVPTPTLDVSHVAAVIEEQHAAKKSKK